MNTRIGLFGGSFDPVHRAHMALARSALEQLVLDELRWVPTGQAWQKARGLTDALHREAMLRLAIEGEPKYRIDRCEIERTGPSYTIDTVQQLKQQMPGAQLFLLIGQDQFAGLHTWRRFEELLREVTLVLAQRPGANDPVDERVRSAPRQVLDLPAMAVSSSEIRTRVAAGQAIDAMVSTAVAQYIHQHRLYRGGNGS